MDIVKLRAFHAVLSGRSTLTVKVVRSFKKLITIYHDTCRHIPKESNLIQINIILVVHTHTVTVLQETHCFRTFRLSPSRYILQYVYKRLMKRCYLNQESINEPMLSSLLDLYQMSQVNSLTILFNNVQHLILLPMPSACPTHLTFRNHCNNNR